MRIEWGKVREFALATGCDNAGYLDDDAAPIPPTFLVTSRFWEPRDVDPADQPHVQALERLGLTTDLRRFLSGEHEYVFYGQLPRVGDRLCLTERFDGAVPKTGKRGGRMTLLHHTTAFRSPDGTLRAEWAHTSIHTEHAVRQEPRDGPQPAAAPRPSALQERCFGPLTMTDIVRYQGASGDMNPLHHDPVFARSAGYDEPISVGMLGAGYLGTYCADLFGVESVRRIRVRFHDIVRPGDVLTAGGRPVRTFVASGEARTELELHLVRQTGAIAVEASVDVAN